MASTPLPIVDFSILNLDKVKPIEVTALRDTGKLQYLADEVMAAFDRTGFCLIRNHGLSQEKLDDVFSLTRDVFSLPADVKMKYARRDDALIHGYVNQDIERYGDNSLGTYESFMVWPRKAWCFPEEVPRFEDSTMDLFLDFQEFTYRVLDVLSVGLHMEDRDFFRRAHGDMVVNNGELRCSFYKGFPQDFEPEPGQLRFMEHHDLGTVSFIYQDDVGGLEVRSPDGKWLAVPYIPGTIVMLSGQLMQIWTTDRLKAAKHRVVIHEDKELRQKDRQSLIFFPVTPDDFVFKCLDGSDKYPPVTMEEFCFTRLYKNVFSEI